ncbi:MAG: DUF2752 domain-containing protein [Verrucomicrobiae bacterium]|nr:DUF2752 domain-containing protein [Verrucomicrobiae bacterium]MCX7915087.1 DUF2752 domain-containing protein [Verrucomicrobiae bacterium]MDW8342911.1 DUF2752 domain-containing protein [Verrucomicrobiae bacterium]
MRLAWGGRASSGGFPHWCGAGLLCLAVALGALLYWFEPSTTPWWPRCWFYEATGWQCIGCGMSRAFHSALHGDWAAAWRLNPLVWLAVPWAAAVWVTSNRTRRWLIACGVGSAVGFLVWRNATLIWFAQLVYTN